MILHRAYRDAAIEVPRHLPLVPGYDYSFPVADISFYRGHFDSDTEG